MESPPRPFHSRKLSNATIFSDKNAYATVFSGHRRNSAGLSAVDVQDYREIFNTSQPSSIPVLDLSISSLAQQSGGLSFKFRDANPDYSEIFGGFRDEEVAVCYDKLFGLDKASVAFRAPSSRTPTSQDSGDLSDQSSDVLKQFSMSYNKINQKFKDGLDGAKHVTQVPAVTGFTCFIDEPVMVGEKGGPPAVDPVESVSEVAKSRKSDIGFRLHPSRVVDRRNDARRTVNSEAFRADFDEEVDVTSAASALKKAIEKAQESIRIAKESVGRKKNGLRSVSNKKVKNGLKFEGEEQKCRDEDSTQYFQERNVIHGEKLYVAKKFLDEIHEKISGSTKSSKLGDDSVVYDALQVTSETDSRFLDSSGKDESATLCPEEISTKISKIHVSDDHQTDNTFEDENESRIKVTKSTFEELESRESNNEVRLSDAHEFVEELNNLNVSPKGEDLDQNDAHNGLRKEQVDVVEHEDSDDAESEKYEEVEEASESVKSDEMFDDSGESDAKDSVKTGDDKIEELEVNLHDDNCETKQEDNPEDLDQSSDLEFDLKSLDDDMVFKETDDIDCIHVSSSNLEMNGIKVETYQDFDDVAEVSCEFDAQTISEENNEKSGIEITNEVQDSQEPECRNKEDETEEPGPSKESGKDRFKRINEEAAAREREWERNRLAVERAIREARERAFAEARERAERERAAVEKATEEVRQRMMAEAREKVAKASVTSKSSDKTSERAKLKAERAAVERATSEARQRALEKAISQKTAFDLNRTESALRTKAKLEKQNRIMERAAKALAEKEKRDRLAQKEQAERHRLAENLDADIKRWANGKEGNLRALLSTLQYILGPESGWQAVSLTEIISSSAVKKAYRKATLCVHPDKLQQRGATVQHKYICEKVFDLLKAAWNRFNSEER